MTESDWKIVYLTAGAGGMYCGSCMHDNTLARELSRMGVDIQLVPTYTPIRTDEESVASQRIFFGGISVYLQHKMPWLAWIPGLGKLLDQPWLINWAVGRGVKTTAQDLGALTVDMLRGSRGVLKGEVSKLCRWLAEDVRPNVVVLSNLLIGGCLPDVRAATGATMIVTLQGDDIFLQDLPEPYQSSALRELARLAEAVDGFVCNSHYYADFMTDYLKLDRNRVHVVPLGLDVRDWPLNESTTRPTDRPPTIGYLARLAPEKGFQLLVDAFIQLKKMPGMEQARLRAAGWLGENHREFAQREFDRLREAGFTDSFEYVGSIDRNAKRQFLESIDVLSVPTVYREPKGLFVLEALAAGIPVVQPSHGAFPEVLSDVGGGELVAPNNPAELATALHGLLVDATRRNELGRTGQRNVHDRRNSVVMAKSTLDTFQKIRLSKR